MEQLALLEVPPAERPPRPRRPRLTAEVVRAALQALEHARAGHGHGLASDELAGVKRWLARCDDWLKDRTFPRPRTSAVRAWRLSALAHWAAAQDLYLEGLTAAELRDWCLRLARWSEG